MTSGLVWSNVIAYSLQIGLLVGMAAFAPALLRLRSPGARLAYWQILLAACLLLPLVRPWRQQAIEDTVSVTTRVVSVAAPDAAAPRRIPAGQMALGALAFGAAARLIWLAAGFWQLGRRRRRSRPIESRLPWPSRAELRISDEVASPVTFGAWRPVVLLPPQYPSLEARAQEAILCHELLHVERRDWLFTVAEELVRALFWFHPAIWWLLGEIQLAREQAVDRRVIEMTQAREEYVDALLAIAGVRPELDLAPAPLFLRRRHLKQRVVSILKEVRMSKTRLASALAMSICVLAAAGWFVTNTFPLAAAPQVVADAPGVTVDLGGATLLHRTGVGYPEAARAKRIQGTVALELTFDGNGNVTDARALSGPEELRKPALESVLQWHFAHEASGNRRQVTIAFQPPDMPAAAEAARKGAARELTPPQEAGAATVRRERTIQSIEFAGVSEDVRGELLSKLPIRAGGTLTPDLLMSSAKIVKDFDEHLRLVATPAGEYQTAVVIVPNEPAVRMVASDSGDKTLRVGGNVQSTKLIRQPRPVYPQDAKDARIQGVVHLMAIIAKDGTVAKLEVISGHPLLVASALEAVKQWVYQPTLLNGDPVAVQTQIDVNYTLSQ